MKLLNYICICGAIGIFAACKKSGSGNVQINVSSTVPAQISIKEYADANHPTIDTISPDLTNFNYSFKGIAGQTLILNVIATGPSTLTISTSYNGNALNPLSASQASDGSSVSAVYGIPN
jgi:hypothetical protein